MEIIIFVIPFIVAVFLLCFFRKETVWWEYLLLIVPSLLISLFFEFIFKRANISDTEYLGDYVTKIRHEDPWNEWVHRICSRRVRCGGTLKHPRYRTVYYDCSYCREHPDRWYYYTQNGTQIPVTRETWEKIRDRLGEPMIFIDCHRRFHTKDGDAQEYRFSGDWRRSWPLTWSHEYQNPILGSRSLFGFTEIPEDSVESWGLYQYPRVFTDQNPVLGKNLSHRDNLRLRWLNGSLGKKYQFRLYTLFWNARKYGPEVADLQKSLWQGGNKNELVVCIGEDSGKISWVRCFSWEDSPVMSVRTRMYLESKKTFNAREYAGFITDLLRQGSWKRKKFSEDFDYLEIEISDTQAWIILIITLLYNIGISWWIIVNEFKNDERETRDNNGSPKTTRRSWGGY